MVSEKDTKTRNENFNQYVKQVTPKNSIAKNTWKAFLVGGSDMYHRVSVFTNYYMYLGAGEETGKAYTTVTLIFLAILLTGLGIYQKLAKFGGAGTLVSNYRLCKLSGCTGG